MELKISVVMIGVTNMARAIRFYRHIVGLPLKFKTSAYSEFSTCGAVLALEKRKRVTAIGPAFTIQTQNVKRDARRLRRHGVKFWKPLREEEFGWLFMPKDPEGNIFEIVQYKRRRA